MNGSDHRAKYSFLPWLRQGIANQLKAAPAGAQRATLELAVDVVTDSAAAATVESTVQLVGPGDIVGLSADAIIRHEPRHWITDFEPNYLPFVEFYEEDFPWRYSPMPADESRHRIVPWITLVTLTEEEFADSPALSGPLPSFETTGVPTDVFPPAAQLWAWAHVHVNSDLTTGAGGVPVPVPQSVDRLEKLLEQNPDLGYSRLLCPRKLEPNTAYHAFLVPTFESGRRAGLGEEIDAAVGALDIAWESGQSRFPIYHRWFFRTGERGDFEFLVRLLEPRPVDRRVGIRDMDVSEPGAGIDGIDFGPDRPQVIGMEGALRTPQTESTAWPRDYPEPFQEQLSGFVNQADDIQQASPDSDPVITPPLYARWHALRSRLSLDEDTGPNPYDPQAKWLTELNLDPRHRAAAGLGTRVVQKQQEPLMNQAWEQIGEVLEANRRLKLAQLAELTSWRIYRKHLGPMAEAPRLWLTAPVQRRVLAGEATVARKIEQSRLPGAAVSPEFRRAVRPRGRLARRMVPAAGRRPQRDLLRRINDGAITATPEKRPPPGAVDLDQAADALLPKGVSREEAKKYRKKPFSRLFPRKAKKVRASDTLRPENLTPEAVDELPDSPGFRVTEPQEEVDFPAGSGDSEEAHRFKLALKDLHTWLVDVPSVPPPRPPLAIGLMIGHVMTTLDPKVTLPKRVLSSLLIPGLIRVTMADRVVPVMAYPEFPQPMYEPLRDISSELLIPNINLVPQNTISLLETNQKFIESYMVGLNHEMGRELLWREYPTDQRGSYFRQFWDVREFVNRDTSLSEEELAEKLKDIPEIHTWLSTTALGTHNHRESGGDSSQLVLLIRGDLLKRYPNTIIYAHRADWQRQDGEIQRLEPRRLAPVDTAEEQAANERYPLYSAQLRPDIYFLGFDLTAEEARGADDDDPGWFFVLKERVGEPRFGLDLEAEGVEVPLTDWDDLSWQDIEDDFAAGGHVSLTADRDKLQPANNPAGVEWHDGSNAADLAFILYQDPVLVAIHAQEMLRF